MSVRLMHSAVREKNSSRSELSREDTYSLRSVMQHGFEPNRSK